MQATADVGMTEADAMNAIENLFAVLKVKTNVERVPLSQLKLKIAQTVEGLIHMITMDVCHGDLKSSNNFRSDRRFDIGDYDGAMKIADMIKLMKEAFALDSEAERLAMNKFLNVFCVPTATEKLEAACARHGPQIQQLVKWGIVTQKKGEAIPVVAMFKKGRLAELREYLKIKCHPDITNGFGYVPYMDMICTYFWRCDAENYRQACNAFDMRAHGVTIFVNFTASETPTDNAQKDYYDKLEGSLRALQEEKVVDGVASVVRISEKAISIIRRMAEPMRDVDTSPGKVFPLPVSIEELKELKAELLR